MAYEKKPAPKGKGAHLYKHGLISHPLYGRWRRMIQRCTDPNTKEYSHYGGRGLAVCDRWLSFENFLNDMGEPMKGQELDRIDNAKGYEPTNCRWVSHSENMKNTRRSVIISFNGVTQNLKNWAQQIGIDQAALRYRLDRWPLEKALSTTKFKTNGKTA